jgi:hypothetical protein
VAVVQFAPCTFYTTFIYSNLNLTYKLNNYTIWCYNTNYSMLLWCWFSRIVWLIFHLVAQGKLVINYESHCHRAQCWFDVSLCESCNTLAAWHISNWWTNFEESISEAEHSKRFFINFHHKNFSLMWKFSSFFGWKFQPFKK